MKRVLAVAATSAALLSSPAYAHHSFAMFDMQKTATITATVKEIQWTNPHVWLQLVVMTDSGPQEWGIEGGPPTMLKLKGLRADTVHPGDKVIVKAHPLRNGAPGGSLISISRPDGSTIFSETGPYR
jgi:hypothetical protein